MIIGWGNVGGQGAQSVEGGLITPLQLLLHVLWNLVQGYVPWALIHYLL